MKCAVAGLVASMCSSCETLFLPVFLEFVAHDDFLARLVAGFVEDGAAALLRLVDCPAGEDAATSVTSFWV
jgi:hypothetical protein